MSFIFHSVLQNIISVVVVSIFCEMKGNKGKIDTSPNIWIHLKVAQIRTILSTVNKQCGLCLVHHTLDTKKKTCHGCHAEHDVFSVKSFCMSWRLWTDEMISHSTVTLSTNWFLEKNAQNCKLCAYTWTRMKPHKYNTVGMSKELVSQMTDKIQHYMDVWWKQSI